MSISIRTPTMHTDCRPKPRSIWARLGNIFALRKERRHLLLLDDHMLKDIGITRSQAVEEGRKLPWDAPSHWHK